MKKTTKKISSNMSAKSAVKKAAIKKKKTASSAGTTNLTAGAASINKFNKQFKNIAILMLIVGVLYFAKNLFVVALVNGQPISRVKIIKELEKRQGQTYLDQLVNETLIYQEASKQNITVKSEDIDSEIAQLEENFSAQGSTLDQLLEMQGMSREDLVKQIELQKMIEAMLVNQVEISDEEIDTYIESNQDIFPEDQDPEQLREDVKAQLTQQKMSEQFQTLLESLQESAKIHYFVKY